MNLGDTRFTKVQDRVLEIVVNPPGGKQTAVTHLNACFIIKSGLNGLLDVAKKTYCEISQEIDDNVNKLKEKYQLPLRLGYSQSKGYHIQIGGPKDIIREDSLPSELILVQRVRNSVTCYTSKLVALDQRCQQALNEIKMMNNVLIFGLLSDIRSDIQCLFPLCEYVAELDVCLALAHAATAPGYIKPSFGPQLHLRDARHPILDVVSKERVVPNHAFADNENNFIILTGPNESGKSIYIRQIALLQIMAQIGCYVPAREATFRISDRIFSRIGFDDSIEGNASTLMVEIQDMEFIRRNITPSSLVIVDELCRGTSIEEGTCLAFAICEQLLDTTAFTFFTTHFLFLTKLQNIYHNVRNFHFEAELGSGTGGSLHYSHRMLMGVTTAENYGIHLAQLMRFPESVLQSAKGFTQILAAELKPQPTVCNLTDRYLIAREFCQQLPHAAPWEQLFPVIKQYMERYHTDLPSEDEYLRQILDPTFLENLPEKRTKTRSQELEDVGASSSNVPDSRQINNPVKSTSDETSENIEDSGQNPTSPCATNLNVENFEVRHLAENLNLTNSESPGPHSEGTKEVAHLLLSLGQGYTDENKEVDQNIPQQMVKGKKRATSKDMKKKMTLKPGKKLETIQSVLQEVRQMLPQDVNKAEYYEWKYFSGANVTNNSKQVKYSKSRNYEILHSSSAFKENTPPILEQVCDQVLTSSNADSEPNLNSQPTTSPHNLF